MCYVMFLSKYISKVPQRKKAFPARDVHGTVLWCPVEFQSAKMIPTLMSFKGIPLSYKIKLLWRLCHWKYFVIGKIIMRFISGILMWKRRLGKWMPVLTSIGVRKHLKAMLLYTSKLCNFTVPLCRLCTRMLCALVLTWIFVALNESATPWHKLPLWNQEQGCYWYCSGTPSL